MNLGDECAIYVDSGCLSTLLLLYNIVGYVLALVVHSCVQLRLVATTLLRLHSILRTNTIFECPHLLNDGMHSKPLGRNSRIRKVEKQVLSHEDEVLVPMPRIRVAHARPLNLLCESGGTCVGTEGDG